MAANTRTTSYEKYVENNREALVPIDLSSISDIPAAAISDLDESNPRAVVNLVPDWLRIRIREIPQDLFLLTEDDVVEQIGNRGRPDSSANLLRIAFWDEYDRVQKNKLPKMEMSNVTDRVCSTSYFKQTFVASDLNIVYLLTPPTSYVLSIKECLLMGIQRMRETLSISPVGPNGVNEKLADIQHRMFMTLDMRLNGAITQRIDQRTITANVSPEKIFADQPLSLSDIERRIAELEGKKAAGVLPPASVTVDLMRDVREAEFAEEEKRAPKGPEESLPPSG